MSTPNEHIAAGFEPPGSTPPDATATPRTDAYIKLSDADATDGYPVAEFMRTLERELTAAKAEIARLNSHEGDLVIGCAIVEGARRQEARAVDRLEADSAALRAEVEQLRAQLRERTQWQCKCGGTDCAGMAENERLRAEVERLSGVKNQLERTGFQTVTQLADAWLNHQNTFKSQTAYVAEVEARETQLRSRVDAMEADKARLDWLSTRFPDDDAGDCDPEGIERKWMSVWENSTEGSNLRAAIDAARAGKGAT